MNMMSMSLQRDIRDRARQSAFHRYRSELFMQIEAAAEYARKGDQGVVPSDSDVIGIEHPKAFEVASSGLMP